MARSRNFAKMTSKNTVKEICTNSTIISSEKPVKEMQSKYDSFVVEKGWDNWWNSQGFFKLKTISNSENSEIEQKNEKNDKFIMVIPPPNVTGQLHIGHALMATIEDCMTRWNRMRGRDTLWVPGLDHSGIATQTVVEKELKRTRNLTRFDLGREKFIKEVWEWKKKYGSKINEQLRRMGASLDWDREFYTMDDNLSRAVTEAFIRLYNDGKIYRAKRFVNWSCWLTTAIADCEVDKIEVPKRTLFEVPGHNHKVEFGVIHKFTYKIADSTEFIPIETTRPETMMGDVAVAVHPEDNRYKHLIGKYAEHPFASRRMKIIADATLVDMEKGTGAVKITPAHDENDYDCGQRHNLESIRVFDENGKMNSFGGKYEGMMRFDCRFQIVKDLEKIGQYHGRRDFQQIVCFCSRSKDVIEPINTSQWWVNCDEMAEKSIKSVKNGEIKITPKKEEKTLFNFLENIRPWCISRQLWWGHRIPAFFPFLKSKKLDKEKTENWIVAENEENALILAQKRFGDDLIRIEQDDDVLDTWFSSALVPFAVFGWPEKTSDLENFYPNSILETGSDILFFWVARMMFMSLQLNNKIPFKEILLHPMVRAQDGSKMSKSKGNVINPLEVIEGVTLENLLKQLDESNMSEKMIIKYKKLKSKEYPNGIPACGADALRFGLLCYLNQGRSINLDINRVIGYSMFCNKIWQAANFTFPKLEKASKIENLTLKSAKNDVLKTEFIKNLSLGAKWILLKLNETCEAIESNMKSYEFSKAASKIYNFWLKEFCDIFLELIKPIYFATPQNNDEINSTNKVLLFVFSRALQILHPMMPFITEELWQKTPGLNLGKNDSISITKYPQFSSEHCFDKETVLEPMNLAFKIAKAIRSARMNYSLGNAKIETIIKSKNKIAKIEAVSNEISIMANIKKLTILIDNEQNLEKTKKFTFDVVDGDSSVHIKIDNKTALEPKIKKLSKKESFLKATLKKLRSNISNEKRLEKVPKEVIKAEIEKEKESAVELEKLEASLKQLKFLFENGENDN